MLFSTCPAASVYSSGASLIHAEFIGRLCQRPAANIGVSPNALKQRLRLITQFAVHNPRRGCVRMRFDFACAENVQDFNPARFEIIRDKRAMTTPPDCFRAHDGGPACVRSKLEQSVDSFLEFPGLHVISVPAKRRVMPRSVARVWFGFSFAAKLRKMFVTDFVSIQ